MSRSGSTEQDANFLGRWARRKAQAKSDKPADTAPVAPGPEVAPEATRQTTPSVPADPAAPDATTPEPIPSLDSLDENSSYARFMASDVEKDLRRLALRKLFKAPAFNIRDGLDDYDDDFTSFEKLGSIVTADMKFHKERLEAEAAKEHEEQEKRLLAQNDETTEPDDQEMVANAETDNESAPEAAVDTDANASDTPIATPRQSDPLIGEATEPGLVSPPQPWQLLPETAPPVLAPRRQGLRLRTDTPDDTQDA